MADSNLTSEPVTFEVGEVAIYNGKCYYPENEGSGISEGEEVTVIRCLAYWPNTRGEVEYGYVCAHRYTGRSGQIFAPDQLRKKRPPREDLKVVRWDQCPWQPEKIHV